MNTHSLTNADDDRLIDLIGRARRRIVLVAPGLSGNVAEALVAAWKRLGTGAVRIVLDVDSEVCRLGYGTIDGLKLIHQQAADLRASIAHQTGIRIGLLVADDATLVFSPTPLLIEAGANREDQPNAILLDAVPSAVASDLGLDPGPETSWVGGLSPLDEVKMKRVEKDLSAAPPQPFDLARQVRVYTSVIQFVELSMKGCSLSRKKVRIPSFLLGLARNPEVQQHVEAHFSLLADEELEVGDGDERISEAILLKERRKIEDEFLIVLPGYGTVVFRSKKADFIKAVEALQEQVDHYASAIRDALQARINSSRLGIVEALLPAVIESPPTQWLKHYATPPTEKDLKSELKMELKQAFGEASDYLDEMTVKVVFKDVAYESLVDQRFLATARKTIRGVLHEEYDAARTRPEVS